MRRYFRQLSTAVFLSALLLIMPVLVQGAVIEIENPLEADTFEEFIIDIVDVIYTFALAVAPIMIIVAGFYFLTSVGEPAKINTAKQIILWTLIGLLIVISARGIIELFQEEFLPPPTP